MCFSFITRVQTICWQRITGTTVVTTMECMTITTTTRGDINPATTTLAATTLTTTTLDTTTLHTTMPTDPTTGEATPGITRAVPTDRITLDITTTQDILTEIILHIVGTIQALTSIIPAIRNIIPTILLTIDTTIQDTTRVDSTIVMVSTEAVMLLE